MLRAQFSMILNDLEGHFIHNSCCIQNTTSIYKDQSSLAKGGIARVIMLYAKEIQSISDLLLCHVMSGPPFWERGGRRESEVNRK